MGGGGDFCVGAWTNSFALLVFPLRCRSLSAEATFFGGIWFGEHTKSARSFTVYLRAKKEVDLHLLTATYMIFFRS